MGSKKGKMKLEYGNRLIDDAKCPLWNSYQHTIYMFYMPKNQNGYKKFQNSTTNRKNLEEVPETLSRGGVQESKYEFKIPIIVHINDHVKI